MYVRIKTVVLPASDKASTAVGKRIELVHSGSDRPRHVVDLISIRRLTILYEEIIEILRDTNRHMQILPERLRNRITSIAALALAP